MRKTVRKILLPILLPLDYKKILLVTFMILSNVAYPQIYKCVGDSGEVKFQSKECAINERSKIMVIKHVSKPNKETEPKLQHASRSEPLEKYKNSPERARKKQLKKQKKQRCALLRRKFKREEKKVHDRCKRNRETFCGMSAVRIEQNERRRAIYQISNSGLGGTVRIPRNSTVELVKKELTKNGCR